jgi:hypothetical protein
MSTAVDFALTTAERNFTHHFNRETCNAEPGPAIDWLVQNRLSLGAMTAFQYWSQKNDEDFLVRSMTQSLPPFEIPWASREEFLSRIDEIMVIYPELSTWRFAQP